MPNFDSPFKGRLCSSYKLLPGTKKFWWTISKCFIHWYKNVKLVRNTSKQISKLILHLKISYGKYKTFFNIYFLSFIITTRYKIYKIFYFQNEYITETFKKTYISHLWGSSLPGDITIYSGLYFNNYLHKMHGVYRPQQHFF